MLNLQDWPDSLHVAVLTHLGSPKHPEGYLWPYTTLCRACHSAASTPALWRCLDLSNDRNCEDDVAASAAAANPELQEAFRLRLTSGLKSGPELIGFMRRYCSQSLERLSLTGLEIVDDDFVLSLIDVFQDGPLKALDLGYCPNISGSILPELGRIPTLTSIGAACLTTLEDEDLSTLCLANKKLDRLDLRFCEWLQNSSVFSGRPWKSLLLDGCPRLEVTALLKPAPELVELSLDGEELEAEQYALLPTVFPRLKRLDISFAREVDAQVLIALASLLDLRALTLRKAALPSDLDWAAFLARHRQEAATAAVRGERRRRGNGGECGGGYGCFGDEGGGAETGGEGATSTATATLEEMTEDDDALGELPLTGPNGEQVELWTCFSVAECEHFADEAALTLAASWLPRMQELDLSWCWQLSDKGLGKLLAQCPRLTNLKLAGMKSVSGLGLAPCVNMPGLAKLDCTSCNSVQDLLLEFLHRLFSGPIGSGQMDAFQGFPADTPTVAAVASRLWKKRSVALPRLQVKNYYAEYLENWAQLRPIPDVLQFAEQLLIQGL